MIRVNSVRKDEDTEKKGAFEFEQKPLALAS